MAYTPEELAAYKAMKAQANTPSYTPEELAQYKQMKLDKQSFGENVKRGFLYGEDTGVGGFVGKSGPAIAGGLLGMAAGPAGAALGAASGEAARRGAAEAITGGAAGTTIAGNIAGPAFEATSQIAGAKVLPQVAKGAQYLAKETKVIPFLADTAQSIIKGTGENIIKPWLSSLSGMSEQAIQRFYDMPSTMAQYIKTTPADVAKAGKAFVGIIEQNTSNIGKAYESIIKGIMDKSGKYGPGFRLDLQAPLESAIVKARNEFGYGIPGRIGDEAEQKIFDAFNQRAMQLGTATLEDAYFFQKDLTNAIRRNVGKPISAALGRIKSAVRETLDNSVPEIAEANAIYAQGMELADDLVRIAGSDTPDRAISAAMAKDSKTWDALKELADGVSGARIALEDFTNKQAGAQALKIVPKFGKTGFYPGAIMAGGLAMSNDAVLTAGAASAPFLSPRLTALATRTAGRTAAGLGSEPVKNLGLVGGSQQIADIMRRKYMDQK